MSELDPTARALLAAGRHADDPSDDELSRVERSLMAKVAIGAGASIGIGATTTKAAGASSLFKLASGLILAGAVAGGVMLARQQPATTPVESAARPSSAPAKLEPLATAVVPVSPLPESAPSPESAPVEPAKRDGTAKPESPALKLKQEAALVGDAQRALGAGRPSEALSRLAEYDGRFPSGALRSEADATRVFALCQSGRAREGAAAKESFLRRYPSSPAVPRVRSACSSAR